MTSASERSRSRKSANAAADNDNLELLEIRG